MRKARLYVADGLCTVCMRRYPSRTKFLGHLHEKMEICLINTMLTMPHLSEEVVEEANRKQAAPEQKARNAGEHFAYTEALCGQTYGPMRRQQCILGVARYP